MQSWGTEALWLRGPLFPHSAAGNLLRGWEVFPLQLDDVSSLSYDSRTATSGNGAVTSIGAAASAGAMASFRRRLLEAPSVVAAASAGAGKAADVPIFFRQVAGPGKSASAGEPVCCHLFYACRRAVTPATSASLVALLDDPAACCRLPAVCRGGFSIDDASATRGSSGHLADTYLAVHGWGKGIAWVNGFNLGWYWPSQGPQVRGAGRQGCSAV
jgi:beta-galactosidase